MCERLYEGGNDIAEGAEYINRVMVRRFKVDPIRDMSESEYLKRAKPVRRLRMFLYRIRGLRLFSILYQFGLIIDKKNWNL